MHMAFLSRVFKNLQWYGMTRGRKVYFAATFFYGFEKLKKIRKSTCIFEEAVLLYQLRLRNDPPWRKR